MRDDFYRTWPQSISWQRSLNMRESVTISKEIRPSAPSSNTHTTLSHTLEIFFSKKKKKWIFSSPWHRVGWSVHNVNIYIVPLFKNPPQLWWLWFIAMLQSSCLMPACLCVNKIKLCEDIIFLVRGFLPSDTRRWFNVGKQRQAEPQISGWS